MKLQKFLPLALKSMALTIGEMALIGLVLVVPCFVIFLPGLGVKISTQNQDYLILAMQSVGFLCYSVTLLTKVATMIGGRNPRPDGAERSEVSHGDS